MSARWKKGVCLLWCLVTVVPVLAAPRCPPAPSVPSANELAQAQAQARDRGFLWRIRRDERVSYLYGTLHVGKLAWVFPGPQVKEALGQSDTVALELDLQDASLLSEMQQGSAPQPDAPTVPEDLMRRLRAQIRAACLPEEVQQSLATQYSPELVLTTLVVLSARQDGLDASYAVDLMLSRLAHQAHKTVVSLESPTDQLALLRAESPEALLEGLEIGLRSLENRSAQCGMRRVAQMWAQSRYDELHRYPTWCECMDTPQQRDAMKKMLDDRNLGMADRIDRLHAQGQRVFAAVGSLHMVGPLGLPALLARRGYQVERVTFAKLGAAE